MKLIPWKQKRYSETGLTSPEWSLTRLREELDSLLQRFFRDPWDWAGPDSSFALGVATPRLDLAESESHVTVTMELPGVDPQDVDIDVVGNLLTVRGEKKQQKEEKKREYQYVERQFGSFRRTVQLPSTIDPDKVNASYRNGVLTITIDKRPGAKAKKIKVRSA